MSRLTRIVIVLIASMAISACGGSSPSAPSALSTPTLVTPTFSVNVLVATKAQVQYTCAGTSGVPWKFEVEYVGPNIRYFAPSQNPMVLEQGGCGFVSMRPAGGTDVTSVVFRATNPAAPPFELSVELK